MAYCINKNSVEYQNLAQRSGISTNILDAVCRNYLDKYNRFPHLDELPGSDSTAYIKDVLKLDTRNSTSVDNILNYTKENSIEESVIKLNDQCRDVEVIVLPLGQQAIVNIQHRPYYNKVVKKSEKYPQDTNVNNTVLFNTQLETLANKYGINFIPITTKELSQEEWKPIVASAIDTKAFVYNDNIYINTDNCSVDSPLHEMMHIFLGSMRFTQPELYTAIVQSMENLPKYEFEINRFPNRTRLDVNEELFIEEFAKYVTQQKSAIDELPKAVKYEMFYNVNRVLDTILFGEYSVKGVSDVYNLTLRELSEKLNSSLLNNTFSGTLNVKDANRHRLLANKKSALMKSNELKEYC